MTKLKFQGVWVALATPFDQSGAVCFKSLEALIDRQIEAGIDGFVPLGTTGESPTLSFDERSKILALVVEKARRHSKGVIAGCGGNDTKKVIELTRQAGDLGADGVLVITPYYNKPTQEGLCQHFLSIAAVSPLPLILYHSPPRTGVALSFESFSRLFEHPGIVGVKEASGDHKVWLSLAEHFRKTGKALLAGDDDMMATFLAMGAHGIISASCNVIPQPMVRIWRQSQEEKLDLAFEMQIAILPMVRALFAETNPGPIKYALSRLGVCENTLRLPLVSVRPETQKLIDHAIDQIKNEELL